MNETLLRKDDSQSAVTSREGMIFPRYQDTLENSIILSINNYGYLANINKSGIQWLGIKNIHKPCIIHIDDYLTSLYPSFQQLSSDECKSMALHQVWFPDDNEFKLCFVICSRESECFKYNIKPIKNWELFGQAIEKILEVEEFACQHQEKYRSLTKREKEIVALIAKGLNSKEIADVLFISRYTVAEHRKNINKKLKVCSPMEVSKFNEVFHAFKVKGI